MYEYKYVPVQAAGMMMAEFKNRREIIDQLAGQGWRYAGWMPAKLGVDGSIAHIDLVFEREASAS